MAKEYTTKILKNGEKRYVFDVDLGYIAGKRRRTTISAKSIKEGRETSAQLRLELGIISSADSPTFKIAFDLYVKSLEDGDKALQTIRHKKSAVKHYIDIWDKKIDRVTTEDIIFVCEQLKEKKLNNNTIFEIETSMTSFFNFCVKRNFIKTNPMANKERVKKVPYKINFLTEEEFKEFIKKVDDSHLRLFLTTLFYTGLRLSECLGLQFGNIINRELHLTHTRIRNASTLTENFKTPNSKRIVPLPKWLDLGTGNERELIFPMSETWYRHNYTRYRKILKLDHIRLHDFRHSYVAMLINKGVDIYTIKDLVGHNKITTTMDVYGHLYEEKRKSVGDLL